LTSPPRNPGLLLGPEKPGWFRGARKAPGRATRPLDLATRAPTRHKASSFGQPWIEIQEKPVERGFGPLAGGRRQSTFPRSRAARFFGLPSVRTAPAKVRRTMERWSRGFLTPHFRANRLPGLRPRTSRPIRWGAESGSSDTCPKAPRPNPGTIDRRPRLPRVFIRRQSGGGLFGGRPRRSRDRRGGSGARLHLEGRFLHQAGSRTLLRRAFQAGAAGRTSPRGDPPTNPGVASCSDEAGPNGPSTRTRKHEVRTLIRRMSQGNQRPIVLSTQHPRGRSRAVFCTAARIHSSRAGPPILFDGVRPTDLPEGEGPARRGSFPAGFTTGGNARGPQG